MDNLLVAAGIGIIIFVLWRDWVKKTTLQIEREDDRKLLGELADARREVQILLDQLENASEKIVDEISYGLEEIKLQVSSAIDKGEDREDIGARTRGKTTISKLSKRTNQSVVSSVSITPDKAAALVTQRTVVKKKERDASSGKESHNNEVPPKHQMVYAMADMGHTEEDIAKQMKIGKGEVSLLLQLRRRGEEGNV